MTHNRKRTIVLVAFLIFTVLSLSACGTVKNQFNKATQHLRDAPLKGYDKSGALVLEMPDGFSNVATKCDGPNRVYTAFHNNKSYGAVAVAPNDPRCTAAGG